MERSTNFQSQELQTYFKLWPNNCKVELLSTQGSNSLVYKVENIDFEITFILKIIKDGGLGKEEAELHAHLQHTGIVKVLDHFSLGTSYAITTEYCQDGSLSKKINMREYNRKVTNNTQSLQYTVRIIFEVASALQYLHSHDIFHRDIKPDNILLHNSQVKLADFGWGKKALATETPCQAIAYRAPEVESGGAYSGSVDIWSLGVIFVQMLTGEVPIIHNNRLNEDFKAKLTPGSLKLANLMICDQSMRISSADLVANLKFMKYGGSAISLASNSAPIQYRPFYFLNKEIIEESLNKIDNWKTKEKDLLNEIESLKLQNQQLKQPNTTKYIQSKHKNLQSKTVGNGISKIDFYKQFRK